MALLLVVTYFGGGSSLGVGLGYVMWESLSAVGTFPLEPRRPKNDLGGRLATRYLDGSTWGPVPLYIGNSPEMRASGREKIPGLPEKTAAAPLASFGSGVQGLPEFARTASIGEFLEFSWPLRRLHANATAESSLGLVFVQVEHVAKG